MFVGGVIIRYHRSVPNLDLLIPNLAEGGNTLTKIFRLGIEILKFKLLPIKSKYDSSSS
jgi:hypothetical protein